jgi:hypothetical protein
VFIKCFESGGLPVSVKSSAVFGLVVLRAAAPDVFDGESLIIKAIFSPTVMDLTGVEGAGFLGDTEHVLAV